MSMKNRRKPHLQNPKCSDEIRFYISKKVYINWVIGWVLKLFTKEKRLRKLLNIGVFCILIMIL